MKRNLNQLNGLIYSGEVLLALTGKGISREDAYRLVQKNAMPVWEGKGDFRALLESDPEVSKLITKAEIEKCFDPAPQLAHVDEIFKRVFGK
jgi:adenylosuccinate lyase